MSNRDYIKGLLIDAESLVMQNMEIDEVVDELEKSYEVAMCSESQ